MPFFDKELWKPMFESKVVIGEFSDIGSMFWNHHMTPRQLQNELNQKWESGYITIHMDENDIVLEMLYVPPSIKDIKEETTLVLKMMVDILEEKS